MKTYPDERPLPKSDWLFVKDGVMKGASAATHEFYKTASGDNARLIGALFHSWMDYFLHIVGEGTPSKILAEFDRLGIPVDDFTRQDIVNRRGHVGLSLEEEKEQEHED
jgi:hypothetical protein